VKLVQSFIVRDEVDIIDAQVSYHLNAGVDLVLATDHGSVDGTTEILESYARQGALRRIPVEGAVHESPWRTRMARLAAIDHGADWVINNDADEFWVPRSGSLKEVLQAVPAQFGVVSGLSRHFVPRVGDDEQPFAERMTVRVSSVAAINDPLSPYRPHAKVAHRADAEIVIRHGAHLATSRHRPLFDWYPADVLHFPFRSYEQYVRKCVRRARGDSQLGQYVRALLAKEQGRAEDLYRSMAVDDAAVRRGIAQGALVVDERLRDAMRSIAQGRAMPRELDSVDVEVVAGGATMRDADTVRLARTVDGLALRVNALQLRGDLPGSRAA
jgi:Glycosyl transferase family 2